MALWTRAYDAFVCNCCVMAYIMSIILVLGGMDGLEVQVDILCIDTCRFIYC